VKARRILNNFSRSGCSSHVHDTIDYIGSILPLLGYIFNLGFIEKMLAFYLQGVYNLGDLIGVVVIACVSGLVLSGSPRVLCECIQNQRGAEKFSVTGC
jgi:hypothetical protein